MTAYLGVYRGGVITSVKCEVLKTKRRVCLIKAEGVDDCQLLVQAIRLFKNADLTVPLDRRLWELGFPGGM